MVPVAYYRLMLQLRATEIPEWIVDLARECIAEKVNEYRCHGVVVFEATRELRDLLAFTYGEVNDPTGMAMKAIRLALSEDEPK